jgi:Flp pilus assembly protein TadD
LASGQARLAIADLSRALELQPGDAQACVSRRSVYLCLGRFGLAFADLRQGRPSPLRAIALLVGAPASIAVLAIVVAITVRKRLAARRWAQAQYNHTH